MTEPTFLSELKRRDVYRPAVFYAAAAWRCRRVGLPTPGEVAAEAAQDKAKA